MPATLLWLVVSIAIAKRQCGSRPQWHFGVDDMDLRSRFEGTILGLTIGDTLGRPAEFLHTIDAIRERFGPDGVIDFVADHHPAGTFTDDTQMTLCVARALIRAGHEPLDTLMSAMAKEFIEWSRSAENDRAPGTTCMAGCRNLGRGMGWQEAGSRSFGLKSVVARQKNFVCAQLTPSKLDLQATLRVKRYFLGLQGAFAIFYRSSPVGAAHSVRFFNPVRSATALRRSLPITSAGEMATADRPSNL